MKKLIIRNKRTEALAIEHDEEKVHFLVEKRDEQTRTKTKPISIKKTSSEPTHHKNHKPSSIILIQHNYITSYNILSFSYFTFKMQESSSYFHGR